MSHAPDAWLPCGTSSNTNEDRQMAKTVGENEREMRDILAEAVEAEQEWTLRIARKAGEALEEVSPYAPKLPPSQMRPDPRGPTRTIVAVERRPDRTDLLLSCGHTGRFNQTFHYKVGSDTRCFACREKETDR